MMDPGSISILIFVVLGFFLAVSSNTCIVIVNLETIRKKGKLSPSDVIFMGKGMVNVLLQGLVTVQGSLFVLCPEVFYIREVYSSMNVLNCLLMHFSFWLTAWLSAHYCISITNLSYGLFIWIKKIVSNYLKEMLFLTTLGTFIVSVLGIGVFSPDSILQSSENITEAPIIRVHLNLSYFVPLALLGCALPFFLSLLCLLLTFSFLVRHVWRVKNNDSGSSLPNLQAHVTALRTIFSLLLIFTSVFLIRIILFITKPTKTTDPLGFVGWILVTLVPSAEAAVIFHASSKLRRIFVSTIGTRNRRNTET